MKCFRIPIDCWAIMFVALFAQGLYAETVSELIEQLVEVDSPDTGYGQYFSGSNFLPYHDTEQLGTLIIGATGRQRSPAMQRIVESGFDAVPELLKHLSDARKVKLPPIESGGFMWIAFNNEYDFNRATTNIAPKGVNLDTFGESKKHPDRHEVTVGDLCFVALGQIFNRNWSSSRYQPTGGRIINSPTWSKEQRQAVLDEWGTLDRDGHRNKLIEDFRNPDSEYRATGAYLRLSLYYPQEVEPLVLEWLNRPIPDGQKTYELFEQLAGIDDAGIRKRNLEAILIQQGQHYRDALQTAFFRRIISADVREENGIELDSDELLARRILHETFDWPKPVKFMDWIRKPISTFDNYELARFVKSLTHDDSVAVGQRVQAMMESERFRDDDYMVEACLTCLASRSQFGDYLAKRLQSHDFQTATKIDFPRSYLAAIAQSKSPAVKEQLTKIAQSSNDPDLFLVAANAITEESWAPVLVRAKDILNGLPPDTKDGKQLLKLIVEKSSSEAEMILSDFLKPNTPSRCNTVCEVLWYGNPLSQKLLLPLLDDDRPIPGFSVNVRNRAATAISHSIESIRFDSDWSKQQRDASIKKIKEYCTNR
ncbi:hypothetical protein SH528x_003611 [Novipirellula sp. SH528]|uniref:hypothetical protein n=1 Tax=Novipirellula sp. SH528 TaxID=3454466 RepID=UPI003FA0F697